MAPRQAARRPTRAAPVSYRESSSEPSASEDEEYTDFEPAEPPIKRLRLSTPQRRTTAPRHKFYPARPERSRAKRAVPSPAKHRHSAATQSQRPAKVVPKPTEALRIIPTDNATPDWTSLPFEILFTIFHYASTPLRDDMLVHAKPSINWLLNTARICRAFKEPALTALYESPPLFELSGPHDLLTLLKQDPASLSMSYFAKIKRLEIHAIRTLAYTASGRGLINVAELVTHMPQLSELSIQDGSEIAPYRVLYRGKGWTYPDNLFNVMSERGTQLAKWHWNAHMLKQASGEGFSDAVASFIHGAHQSAALLELRELSISHLEPNVSRHRDPTEAEIRAYADRMRAVFDPLKKLKALSIVSCSAFEEGWPMALETFPDGLRSLTISNAQTLDAAALQEFLNSRGRHLKELVLDHNQALGLSFTVNLREACPQLESLHMDLTFFNHISTYEDKKPLFDALLFPNERPSWPTTLQSLELLNLRQWSADAAESFFMSLIDSAHELKHLRYLIIKAILSIGWRDRAGFRDAWIGSLQHVFLRKSRDPDPTLASKRAFRESQNLDKQPYLPTADASTGDNEVDDARMTCSQTRRSQRIKTHEAEKAERVADSDSDASLEEISRRNWKLPSEPVIQGLCEVVDINIDNSRPAETQFNEGDFLDSDPGEDEEYVE